MQIIGKTVRAAPVLLGILNLLIPVVSGIWLATFGLWGLIAIGIAAFFISPTVMSFLLMPSALLIPAGIHFEKKGYIFGTVLIGSLSYLYVIWVFLCGV